MSKRSFTPDIKIEVLKVFEDGLLTLAEIVKKYKVNISTIKEWKYKFDTYGTEGLNESSTWKNYSKELKLLAVSDYLSGKHSLREVARRYEVSNESVLRRWINKYNSHREIKDTAKGRSNSMTKGRKTTCDERIQVVLDCLGNGKDYQKTAETYEVSY